MLPGKPSFIIVYWLVRDTSAPYSDASLQYFWMCNERTFNLPDMHLCHSRHMQSAEWLTCCSPTFVLKFSDLETSLWKKSDLVPCTSPWLINHGCRVLLQAASYNIWLIICADMGNVLQWAGSHLASHHGYLAALHCKQFSPQNVLTWFCAVLKL